eukprot:scaffold85550_cov70-Phaeocystis_antarctica.AAC.1
MQAGDRTHIEEVEESARSPGRTREAERSQVHQALQCVRPGRAREAEQEVEVEVDSRSEVDRSHTFGWSG